MHRLIIVGAGGFGREVLEWAKQNDERGAKWNIAGFIDDDTSALDKFKVEYRVLGKISDWEPSEDELFAISIGQPSAKRTIVEALQGRHANFLSLIHPTAIVADSAKLGNGVIICPNAVVSANATVGNFAQINISTAIGHDAEIGDWSTLSSFCDITGQAKVGAETFLGSHVVIVPGVSVGNNVTINAGSIVVSDIRDGSKVFGIPARKFTI